MTARGGSCLADMPDTVDEFSVSANFFATWNRTELPPFVRRKAELGANKGLRFLALVFPYFKPAVATRLGPGGRGA